MFLETKNNPEPSVAYTQSGIYQQATYEQPGRTTQLPVPEYTTLTPAEDKYLSLIADPPPQEDYMSPVDHGNVAPNVYDNPHVYDSIDDKNVIDWNSHQGTPLPKPTSVSSDKQTTSGCTRPGVIIGIVVAVIVVAAVIGVLGYFVGVKNSQVPGSPEPRVDATSSRLDLTTEATGREPASTLTPSTISSKYTMSSNIMTSVTVGTPVSTVTQVELSNLGPGSYDMTSCLRSSDCWVQYDFPHDDIYYPCYGKRYVRYLSKFTMYVGVRVCAEGRYHVFLSRDIQSIFENIFDNNGFGEDHCEFLGGTANGTVGTTYGFTIRMQGYYRSNWGRNPNSRSIYSSRGVTGYTFVPWIECPGVNIPVDSYVVPAMYDPSRRDCYLTVVPIGDRLSWRHSTTPPKALGIENPSSYTWSCNTDPKNNTEVHVISVYESSAISSYQLPDNVSVPLNVTIEPGPGTVTFPITLVLASYSTIDWQITVDRISIKRIQLLAYQRSVPYLKINVRDKNTGAAINPSIEMKAKYLGYGKSNPRDMKTYLEQTFGQITSFIGRYAPTGFTIRTGLYTGI